jgi:hypothetical protein
MTDPTEALHLWHDFYTLVGTAAATLIGVMFVVASIMAVFSERRSQAGVQAFYTPTVVHFTTVLLLCLAVSVPAVGGATLGWLLLAIGAGGAGYAAIVWRRMGRHGFTATIDWADRIWYALSPIAGHLLAVVAALMLLTGHAWGLAVLAVATVALLAAGIRNAWDIAVWMVTRVGRQ